MFSKLTGNNQIKSVFQRFLQNNRVPNSMIFAGIEGVGKRLFALELAKASLCLNPRDFEACDICASCQRVTKFNLPKSFDKDDNEKIFFAEHIDVGFVRPAGRFVTVAQIRDIQSEANFRPYEGKARFFIVDNADRMNEAAANALLKTLEEPPATSHLILLTSRPNSMLQTIRSRCQIIRFTPIATNEIENYLNDKASKDKTISPNDVKLSARIARGSIGKALSVNVETYKNQREMMLNVVESLTVTKDRARLLRVAEEMNGEKLKLEYETRLEILQTLIHDVWTLKIGAENVINQDVQTKLSKFAANVESKSAQTWLNEIENLRENFAINLNRKIATDALFMRMANA